MVASKIRVSCLFVFFCCFISSSVFGARVILKSKTPKAQIQAALKECKEEKKKLEAKIVRLEQKYEQKSEQFYSQAKDLGKVELLEKENEQLNVEISELKKKVIEAEKQVPDDAITQQTDALKQEIEFLKEKLEATKEGEGVTHEMSEKDKQKLEKIEEGFRKALKRVITLEEKRQELRKKINVLEAEIREKEIGIKKRERIEETHEEEKRGMPPVYKPEMPTARPWQKTAPSAPPATSPPPAPPIARKPITEGLLAPREQDRFSYYRDYVVYKVLLDMLKKTRPYFARLIDDFRSKGLDLDTYFKEAGRVSPDLERVDKFIEKKFGLTFFKKVEKNHGIGEGAKNAIEAEATKQFSLDFLNDKLNQRAFTALLEHIGTEIMGVKSTQPTTRLDKYWDNIINRVLLEQLAKEMPEFKITIDKIIQRRIDLDTYLENLASWDKDVKKLENDLEKKFNYNFFKKIEKKYGTAVGANKQVQEAIKQKALETFNTKFFKKSSNRNALTKLMNEIDKDLKK